MVGRYANDSNVVTHPNATAGAEHQALTDEQVRDKAAELMPNDLTEGEQAVWMRVVPELYNANRVKGLYLDFIAQYCVVKCRLDALRADLDEQDWTYITTGRHGMQVKSRPEVAQLNDDWRKWNSLVAQLGLSPATELRFNSKQGSLFNDDGFDQL